MLKVGHRIWKPTVKGELKSCQNDRIHGQAPSNGRVT